MARSAACGFTPNAKRVYLHRNRDYPAAPLRLLARLSAAQARLEVDILKRRGPLLSQTLDLSLPDLPGLVARPDPSAPTHPAPATYVPALDRLVIG